MGLIKAAQAATGTVMADQWKEFFYCDSLEKSAQGAVPQIQTVTTTSFPMVLESQWQMVSVC